MAPNDPPQLSLLDKIDYFLAVGKTLCVFVASLCLAPFRGKSGASTYWKHVAFTAVRTLMNRTTIPQSLWVIPMTDQLYLDACKKHGVPPAIDHLASGADAYWIGSKTAKSVIIYFHGGGFVLPAFSGQYEFAFSLVSSLTKANKDVALLFLDYTIAPQKTYPAQLTQAVDAVQHVMSSVPSRTPEDITISGDSAGGSLAMMVMSHVMHPHPDSTVPRLELSSPLKAAVLVSPWVTFATDSPSWKENAYKDYCSPGPNKVYSETFLGGKPLDRYNDATLTDVEWWRGVENVVGNILITVGGDECALDSISETAKKLEEAHPKGTTAFLAPKECHVPYAINDQIGIKEESQVEKAVKGWLVDRI